MSDVYSNTYSDVYGGLTAAATAADTAHATDAVTTHLSVRATRATADSAPATDAASAAVTFRTPSGGVHLRVWDKTGATLLAVVPEFDTLTVNLEHNDVGSLTFDAPLSGAGVDVFDGLKAAIISAHEGVREVATAHWTTDSDDPGADEGLDRAVSIAGNGTLDLLSWVGLYPDGGLNHLPKLTFGNAAGGVTPGAMLLDLLNRGKGRGCLDGVHGPNVTPTFTATADSAGQPWPFDVWLQYDAGQSLLYVVKDLVERGFVDTRMRRFAWDVFVQDTVLAADRPDVTFHRARELESAPRSADRTSIQTAMLMIGEANVSTEVVNAQGIADYGRREGSSSQSGVTRSSVLSAIGGKQIIDAGRLKAGFTATYSREEGGPQPGVDYFTGMFVRADWYADPNTGANLPLRVRTITTSYDADGGRSAEVELGDLFLEAEIIMARQIEALTKGSSSVTSAPATPVNADVVAPLPPDEVLATSSVEVLPDGIGHAQVLISWPPVLANEDGTLFDDDGGYHVSWQVGTAGGVWTGAVVTEPGATTMLVPNLPPGATFVARVAAWDTNGNHSDPTPSASITLTEDLSPPPSPSPPTLAPTIGGLAVTWDGNPAGYPAVQWPADFAEVRAFVSTTNVFADAVAAGGPLTGPGTIVLTDLPYGVPQYVWLVAYDRVGNASVSPSSTGSGGGGAAGTPTQVLAPDLGGGAVGPDALQFRDFGNKVPDGSFELQATRDRVAAAAWSSGVWSFVAGGASDGGWSLRGNAAVAPATIRELPLITGIEAIAGDKVWFTFKGKGASASGQAQLVVRARDTNGLALADNVLNVSTSDGTWRAPDVGQTFTYTFPSNVATVDVLVRLPAAAQAGTWSFDAVQVRTVVQTAIIDQGAVGTLQIADGAVGTLQAGTIAASKIGTGTMQAASIGLGNGIFTTAAPGVRSGQRLELDATGLRAYSSASTSATTGITVRIGADGTATFTGVIGAGGLSGGTITGTEFYASTVRPRIHISVNPIPFGDDDPYTAGIKFEGFEAQTADARIIGYRYQTTGAPDFNTGVALRGGVANITRAGSVSENAVTVYPRDQTDEQDANIDGFGNVGIAFDVNQENLGTGTAALMRVVLRGHYGNGYNYPGFYHWLNDIGIGFDSGATTGQLSVVNYLSNGYAAVRASAYTSPSEAAAKDDVTDVDAVAILRGAPSRRFRYKDHPADAPHGWKVGPMADDLPGWLHELDRAGRPGLAAHTLAGLACEGVRQLDARLDALAREMKGRG